MDGWTDDGWMDGVTDVRMDGWMDEWMMDGVRWGWGGMGWSPRWSKGGTTRTGFKRDPRLGCKITRRGFSRYKGGRGGGAVGVQKYQAGFTGHKGDPRLGC